MFSEDESAKQRMFSELCLESLTSTLANEEEVLHSRRIMWFEMFPPRHVHECREFFKQYMLARGENDFTSPFFLTRKSKDQIELDIPRTFALNSLVLFTPQSPPSFKSEPPYYTNRAQLLSSFYSPPQFPQF